MLRLSPKVPYVDETALEKESNELSEESKELLSIYHKTFDDERVSACTIMALSNKALHTLGKRRPKAQTLILFYYIDRSVLLENTPCVKFIRNYIWDPSGVVSILMTSFPARK